MRMLCRPRQHGAGYAEVIMLSRRAAVDYSAIAHLGLKRRELLIGSPTIGTVYDSDSIGLQLGAARQSRWESRDNQDENAPLPG
jgi:hypothetical protein